MKVKFLLLVFLTLWAVYAIIEFKDLKPSDDIIMWSLSALTWLVIVFGWVDIIHNYTSDNNNHEPR